MRMKHFCWLAALAYAPVVLAGCGNQQTAQLSESEQTVETSGTESAADEVAADESDQTVAEQVDDAGPGLAVGAKAPDFELKDQSGTSRSLSTLLKDGPVALVFYRSADW